MTAGGGFLDAHTPDASGFRSGKQRKRARGKPNQGWFRKLDTPLERAQAFLSTRRRPSIKKLRRALNIFNA